MIFVIFFTLTCWLVTLRQPRDNWLVTHSHTHLVKTASPFAPSPVHTRVKVPLFKPTIFVYVLHSTLNFNLLY